KPLYTGMAWADQLITYRTGKTQAKAGKGQFFDLAARLRSANFDLAVLLPNSFKSALVCKMAGIRRVVGYERDGRSFLLTDKLLKAEYFAELADRLIDDLGATVLLSAAPKERPIVETIKRYMRHAPVDLSNKGLTLGSLKEIVRRSDLMVTNDTGPRHIAAAFEVPVVTIFGPTHPEWTEINFACERKIAVKVFCGPCQKKICPLDHRCMTLATP